MVLSEGLESNIGSRYCLTTCAAMLGVTLLCSAGRFDRTLVVDVGILDGLVGRAAVDVVSWSSFLIVRADSFSELLKKV